MQIFVFIYAIKRLRVIKSLAISREIIYNKRTFCKMSHSDNAREGEGGDREMHNSSCACWNVFNRFHNIMLPNYTFETTEQDNHRRNQ